METARNGRVRIRKDTCEKRFGPQSGSASTSSVREGVSKGWDRRNRSVEAQHRTRHFAGLHRAERLVHVFETAFLRDHLVELQPALQIKVEIARHVHAEAVRAHHAALQLLLRQKLI